jgi:hypothetical protein
MPTLSTQSPDTTNLDFFYANYANSFGIGFHEDAPNKPKPIPPSIMPTQCLTKNLRGSTKTTHFFKAPNTTLVVKCLCGSFHTNFISQSTQPYTSDTQNFTPTTSMKKQKNLISNITNSAEFIPPSPVASPSLSTHTHQCLFCNLNINCKINNETHFLENDSTTYKNIPCHKTCLNMQNDQGTSSKLSTQSFIDRLQKSTAMEIDTDIQTTENTILPPQKQPESQQQEINDNTSEKTVEDEQILNQQSDKTNTEEQNQQQQQNNNHSKSEPTFNWLQHFPISSEMELNDKLQTPLSFQIFDFLKSNLYSFYPGKIIKPETPTRKPLKANFNQLIRSMAGAKPQFLIDFIFQYNSTIDKKATIPFNILETTLRQLIAKFTTILFTKLNYAKIFASSATIPPYTIQNRFQFCINLARIHLYLTNNYQSIDYKKFAEDFKFYPKRITIHSATTTTDQPGNYVIIKHDNKFNIHLLFNIPKSLFLQNFNIPSLKNSLEHFNNWFENFFPIYNRQFEKPLDKTKVQNFLKYQIRQEFISQLKKYLPSKLTFSEPNNYNNRKSQCIQHANFHILTCSSETCLFIENKTHLFGNLFKNSLEHSYTLFPKKENEIWKAPVLDTSIFHIDGKCEATFLNPIPTKILDTLANTAEEFTCKSNSVPTNIKRRNYYFYQYLSLYHQFAAQNHNIDNFSKEKAIDFITNNIVDTHFLARIITYFDLIKNQNTTYSQIVKFFKETAYPEAEKILSDKFKINFSSPIDIDDSFFLKESSF